MKENKRIISITGPIKTVYVNRNEDNIRFVNNIFDASDYENGFGEISDQLLTNDIVVLSKKIPQDCKLIIQDIIITIESIDLDISDCAITNEIKKTALKKLSQLEIETLGLLGEAVHQKLLIDEEPTKHYPGYLLDYRKEFSINYNFSRIGSKYDDDSMDYPF